MLLSWRPAGLLTKALYKRHMLHLVQHGDYYAKLASENSIMIKDIESFNDKTWLDGLQ